MCRVSKAKIQVPQEEEPHPKGQRMIHITGSADAVLSAKVQAIYVCIQRVYECMTVSSGKG